MEIGINKLFTSTETRDLFVLRAPAIAQAPLSPISFPERAICLMFGFKMRIFARMKAPSGPILLSIKTKRSEETSKKKKKKNKLERSIEEIAVKGAFEVAMMASSSGERLFPVEYKNNTSKATTKKREKEETN